MSQTNHHMFIHHHPSSPSLSTRSYTFINRHPPSWHQLPLTHPSFLFSHHIRTSQVETPYDTAEPNQQQQSIRYPNPITPYPYPNPDCNRSIPKYRTDFEPMSASTFLTPSSLFPFPSTSYPNRKHESLQNTNGPNHRKQSLTQSSP
jgi:hypothetical protein